MTSPASSRRAVARLIDHTVLKPEATRAQVQQVCQEALTYSFASVCVNPYWVPFVASQLAQSDVTVCSVAGFPLGATTTAAKVAETRIALSDGAREIDMVMNVGALRSGDLDIVQRDIAAVVEAAHGGGALVKVILETALLDLAQKLSACRLAVAAGADFVKTSTGFAASGATVEDVALLRAAVGPKVGVKASGGVRTLEEVQKMVAAGANRIGTSAGVAIAEAAGR